jgi:hypothetical protein
MAVAIKSKKSHYLLDPAWQWETTSDPERLRLIEDAKAKIQANPWKYCAGVRKNRWKWEC